MKVISYRRYGPMGDILNRKIDELKLEDEALEQVIGGRLIEDSGKSAKPRQVLEIQCKCGQKIRFTANASSVKCKFCGKVHTFAG